MVRRNADRHDALNGNALHHPSLCQSIQIMSSQEKVQPKIWSLTIKSCDNQTLGSLMQGPHWIIHSKGGKDTSTIDLMHLTMINSASTWFKIVELPMAEYSPTAFKSLGTKIKSGTLI